MLLHQRRMHAASSPLARFSPCHDRHSVNFFWISEYRGDPCTDHLQEPTSLDKIEVTLLWWWNLDCYRNAQNSLHPESQCAPRDSLRSTTRWLLRNSEGLSGSPGLGPTYRSQQIYTMTTKGDEDIAAGYPAFAADGGQKEKIPEGIMKPKGSEPYQRVAEQSQPIDEAPQRIAAGDVKASPARIPERIMRPVPADNRSTADASSAIAAGSPMNADPEHVKIPEGVMKPLTSDAPLASLSADVSSNIAAGEPVDASGVNVDESETKIPEGVVKPNSGAAANIAAGQPVDASGNQSAAAEHATIPEGIMKLSMS